MLTYLHTYRHTYVHTYTLTYLRTYIQTFINTYINQFRQIFDGSNGGLLPICWAQIKLYNRQEDMTTRPAISGMFSGVGTFRHMPFQPLAL